MGHVRLWRQWCACGAEQRGEYLWDDSESRSVHISSYISFRGQFSPCPHITADNPANFRTFSRAFVTAIVATLIATYNTAINSYLTAYNTAYIGTYIATYHYAFIYRIPYFRRRKILLHG